ncbi:translation initiation factor IF-2-like, partial [Polypterus senegalus]|uniref:translation initiation factor IF-2-like n=1 Tax=Polypterus senegalus TaxID=55291 RepID=UPI00196456DB
LSGILHPNATASDGLPRPAFNGGFPRPAQGARAPNFFSPPGGPPGKGIPGDFPGGPGAAKIFPFW